MSEGPLVRSEREGAVAILTIDRPERRNALDSAVRAALLDALDAVREDDAVRVVVLTGSGGHFAAGADVREFAQRTPDEQRRAMSGRRVFEEVAAYPKPTIAMVQGYCLGGGCELALACDLRVAGESARFGQPEVRLGLIPGGGATQRLPRLVGTGAALRLVLTGEPIDAAEAYRLGLVEWLVPDAELRPRTLAVATTLAERSPVALRAAKAAVRAAWEMPLSAGLAHEIELFLACFASADGQEGIRAFVEKRVPEFSGRG